MTVGPFIRGFGSEQLLHPYSLERCGWCRRKRGVTHVELYGALGFDSTARGWRLAYPAYPKVLALIARVSHPLCGPDAGYAISLKRLADQSVASWDAHLQSKLWYEPWLADALLDALLLHTRADRTAYRVEYVGGGPRDGDVRWVSWPGPMHGHDHGYIARSNGRRSVLYVWGPAAMAWRSGVHSTGGSPDESKRR